MLPVVMSRRRRRHPLVSPVTRLVAVDMKARTAVVADRTAIAVAVPCRITAHAHARCGPQLPVADEDVCEPFVSPSRGCRRRVETT